MIAARVLLAAALMSAPAGASASPAGVPASPAAVQGPGRVTLAVVPGLDWVDGPDPAARSLLAGAAFAAVPVVTARGGADCPVDFWLTLSAGARAGLPGDGCDPETPWQDVVRANAERNHGARPGMLASVVGRDGGCVAALEPAVWLAAKDLDGAHDPSGAVDPLACRAHLTDLSGLPSLADALAALRPDRRSLLVLVGLPPPGEHLGAVAVLGDGWPSGLLRGSTRRDGLVTVPDLSELVAPAGEGTPVGDGVRPVVADRMTYDEAVGRLTELDRREHLHRRYHGFFFAAVISLPLLLYIYLSLRRRGGRRIRALALGIAAFPVSGFVVSLLPWWRFPLPWLAVIAGCVASAALLAWLGSRRGPAGVADVVSGVFLVDLLTGGYLQETGLASYSAIAGGRFHGLGNAGFAILGTGVAIAARRYLLLPAAPLVAFPRWGADFGGAVTLVAAFGASVAPRARKTYVALGAAAGLLLALGAAAVDYRRDPAERTHLGRFADDVLHGGWTDTIARKAAAAAHSLLTWYPLLAVGSIVVAWLMLRRHDLRDLAPTVRALAALWLVGSLVNDSGIVVAAVGAAVAVPLLLAHVLERTDRPW